MWFVACSFGYRQLFCCGWMAYFAYFLSIVQAVGLNKTSISWMLGLVAAAASFGVSAAPGCTPKRMALCARTYFTFAFLVCPLHRLVVLLNMSDDELDVNLKALRAMGLPLTFMGTMFTGVVSRMQYNVLQAPKAGSFFMAVGVTFYILLQR